MSEKIKFTYLFEIGHAEVAVRCSVDYIPAFPSSFDDFGSDAHADLTTAHVQLDHGQIGPVPNWLFNILADNLERQGSVWEAMIDELENRL